MGSNTSLHSGRVLAFSLNVLFSCAVEDSVFLLGGAPPFGGISKLLFQNSITYFLVNQSLIWRQKSSRRRRLKADVFDLLKHMIAETIVPIWELSN